MSKVESIGDGVSDSTAQLQSLIDALPNYVMLIDETHTIWMANSAVIHALGRVPQDLVGKYCPNVVHGLDGPFPGCPLEEAVTDGRACEKELHDEKSGRWLRSGVYQTDLTTAEGKRLYLHTTSDITAAKHAGTEVELARQNDALLNRLLRASLEVADLSEVLQFFLETVLSAPWLNILPKGAIFLVGEHPEVLSLAVQKGLSASLLRDCRTVPFGKCLCGRAALSGKTVHEGHVGESHEVVYEGMEPHGHYCVPVRSGMETLGVLTIYIANGHPRGPREEAFLGAVANVLAGVIKHRRAETEREEMRTRLQQSQKMEAIGRLAGGVAHDFNNVLTVISGYTELLQSGMREKDATWKKVEAIRKAAEHAASLTHQLLAFSRRQVLQPRPLDLNGVIEDTRLMLGRLMGEDIVIETRLAEGLGMVMADPGEITQVLMNLAGNARDAMVSGGRITLETANVELDETYVESHVAVVPGPYVLMAVRDTGAGMDAGTQARIFEPFFTTKGPGKGTGLGLAMVYGIIKQSGGNIWVYSEPGKGTLFRIYLPRIVAEMPADIPTGTAGTDCGGTETIMVVEDRGDVRELAAEALRLRGYRVVEACDGVQALELNGKHPGPIDLLLTDMVMPGMGGRDLCAAFRRTRPAVKVLFMSGYTETAAFKASILEEGEAFIQKPFGPRALARKVREVLDSGGTQQVTGP